MALNHFPEEFFKIHIMDYRILKGENMIKKFDLSYDEIDAEEMFGKSTQTINTAIKNLEKRYFAGRNIFRNKTEKSDLLFRWEIKNLLFLLIKIEIDNVFSSSRSSKTGVTDISIKKILDTYDHTNKETTLRNYERWVLEQSFSTISSKEFIEDIDAFAKALTNFWTLVAKYYDLIPTDYFKRVVAEINSFSRGIVDHANKYKELNTNRLPKIAVDQYSVTATLVFGPTRINLETAVVNAINIISDAIYDFDKDGCCSRKQMLKATASFNDTYITIHQTHLEYTDDGMLTQDERETNDYDLDKLRNKVDELMDDYWAEEVRIRRNEPEDNRKIPGLDFYKHKTNEELDEFIKSLKKDVEIYIQLYCIIKLYVSGYMPKEQFYALHKDVSRMSLFEKYENLRYELTTVKLADHPFLPVLCEIERKVWQILRENPEGSVTDFSNISRIISDKVDDFRKETDIVRNQTNTEFANIQNMSFNGDILDGVSIF